MENNKLIAEFMGVRFMPDDEYIERLKENREEGVCFDLGRMESELKYHESWDWLMPVVEKCLDKSDDTMLEQWSDIFDSLPSCNIDKVYEAVVKFISYNKYPFNEGDDYWVEEDGDLVWGVWDDASEEMHDENPNRQYFTEEEVIDHIRTYGVKLYKQ